jgi:hypothetical protein
VIVAAGVALVASGLNLLAFTTDLQAFRAVATLTLLFWLALCLVCSAGLVLMVHARRRGLEVPFYFRALLVLGALAGVLTLSPAIRVLTKNTAEKEESVASANLDLRDRVVQDRSFAGRQLRNSNLSEATLHHVDLGGTDLSESDLRDATFRDVNLSGATLCGADIRGADLRGARGLKAVADWSYVFYDSHTRLPKSLSYILVALPGPVPDTGRDLLYMCSPNIVQRIRG